MVEGGVEWKVKEGEEGGLCDGSGSSSSNTTLEGGRWDGKGFMKGRYAK